MNVLDILLGGGRGGRSGAGGGNMGKIGMALIAYMLMRWYQNAQAGGAARPAPMPAPGGGRMPQQAPAQLPHGDPMQMPPPSSGSAGDNDFGPLIESTRRMPDMSRGGSAGGSMGGGLGGGPGGGGLGDILGDILGGAMGGGRGGAPRGGSSGGGGLDDLLGQILGGGRGGFPGSRASGPQGDPLSDLLRGAGLGGLGGLLAGGAGGGMLADLLQQFDQAGAGDAARSWVSRGENVPVTPDAIEQAFGSDTIDQLASQFGLSRPELLAGLSEALPDVVDQLTPDGRLPTPDEIERWT